MPKASTVAIAVLLLFHTPPPGEEVSIMVLPLHIIVGPVIVFTTGRVFTVIVMVAMSLAGPKINPKAFELDKTMFKLSPNLVVMIVVILLILMALYVKFW